MKTAWDHLYTEYKSKANSQKYRVEVWPQVLGVRETDVGKSVQTFNYKIWGSKVKHGNYS